MLAVMGHHRGDKHTGIFLGRFTDVADKLGVTTATVSKVWEQYCMTNDLAPKHGGGNRRSLSDGDLQLIEVLKRSKPSTTYSELTQCLYEFGIFLKVGHRLPQFATLFGKNYRVVHFHSRKLLLSTRTFYPNRYGIHSTFCRLLAWQRSIHAQLF